MIIRQMFIYTQFNIIEWLNIDSTTQNNYGKWISIGKGTYKFGNCSGWESGESLFSL